MESMVSAVPSPWLTMQKSLDVYARLMVVLFSLLLLSLLGLIGALAGNEWLGDLFLVAAWIAFAIVALLLHNLRVMLVAAMERLRQISDLAGSRPT